MTIKSLILCGILAIIGLNPLQSYAIISGGDCLLPRPGISTAIPGGIKKITTFTYVVPNCRDMCPCAQCRQNTECYCDSGYHSVDSYSNPDDWCTKTCTCEPDCQVGYYGDGKTCTRCPAINGVYGTTSGYTTSRTGCYIPTSRSITDSSGTYNFTSDCKYTN